MRKTAVLGVLAIGAAGLAISTGIPAALAEDAPAATTTLASANNEGKAADGSHSADLSGNGKVLAFASDATNLTKPDDNAASDVFARDLATSTVSLVSATPADIPGNGESRLPAASRNGRFIVFESTASNLVTGDTNSKQDIFVRDTKKNVTVRVSVASDGTQATDASEGARISADGRYVAFTSMATNLVAGTVTNRQIYLHDLETKKTTLVSTAPDGQPGNASSGQYFHGVYRPALSADGRYVAFSSEATNLVTGDTNKTYDIFLRDTVDGTTTLISANKAGAQGNGESGDPTITADGRLVSFSSDATNLVPGDTNKAGDIFVRDVTNKLTYRVSVANDNKQAESVSWDARISASGRYVVFTSNSLNFVPGAERETRIFLRDRLKNTTTHISVNTAGQPANDRSDGGTVSTDGNLVVFQSSATNLVAGAGISNLYLRTLG